MTEMTVLQVAGIVEGCERLADDIGHVGVTTSAVQKASFRESLVKRLEELRAIPSFTRNRAMEPWMRRRHTVYARLTAQLTTYNAVMDESRRKT